MKSAVVVFLTAANAREARRLADALVRERHAACVSVLAGLRSIYRWEGRLERSVEHLLIAKTLRAKLPALTRRVRALHSYSVPEVIALPIQGGNARYLSWLSRSLSADGRNGVP